MVKTVNALKARKHLGQLLEEVFYRDDQYVIERGGRPMAAVVPLWQLEEWRKRRDRVFGMIDELRRTTRGVKPDVVEREVGKAVRAIRTGAVRRKR